MATLLMAASLAINLSSDTGCPLMSDLNTLVAPVEYDESFAR